MEVKTFKLDNFIKLRTTLDDYNNFDILIDFHDRKKRISSNNIMVTLFERNENIVQETRKRGGYYIRDKRNNDIKYIGGVNGRFEYILANDVKDKFCIRQSILNINYSHDWNIIFSNNDSDTFVDKVHRNRKRFECVYTFPEIPQGTKRIVKYGILRNDGSIENVNEEIEGTYILKENINGAIDLYDKETGRLKYICNIGGRYEYYFKGKYKTTFYDLNEDHNDIVAELKYDKEGKYWYSIYTLYAPNDNPFITEERPDGGVNLISKDDGSLKYICNIGKRFYYVPCKNNCK